MKPKDKPGSKISTAQSNTNRANTNRANTHQKTYNTDPESLNLGTSLLKKNEFALIIVGALVITVIVFFVFFKSSGPKTKDLPDVSSTDTRGSFLELEKRIGDIESVLETLQAQGAGTLGATAHDAIAPLDQKIQRIETSASVKIDSLIGRMGKVEKQLRSLNQKSGTQPTPVKTSVAVKSPQKTPSKKIVKKSTKTPGKKASIFHTVQKGETLWSIAQKYKTSVANLRKLNNMSSAATIYPGTNILVR